MRPDDVGLGGFDSHTLPPAALSVAVACVVLLVAFAQPAVAQQRDTTIVSPALKPLAQERPPVSPRKAFLHSALVPGLGQSELGRRFTGVGFFLVEALSIAFVHRSAEDLRTAKAFQGDSVPLRYDIDPATGLARRDGRGDPVIAAWQPSGYTDALVRARKLQLEDWVAVLIFNHLVSGADAFVSANLWDFPQHVKLRAFPAPRGAGISLSASFR